MRDEQHRHPALAVHAAQEADALGLVAQVEVRGRLVEHEQARLLGERAREHRALALAAASARRARRPASSSTPVAAIAARATARSCALSKKRPGACG